MTTTVHIKNDDYSAHDIKVTNQGNKSVLKAGQSAIVYCYDGSDIVIEELPIVITTFPKADNK
jgi:pectin methylesterase-like acyl-CoA thioesterase